LGLSELLERTTLNSDQSELVTGICSSGQQLLRLVNDLLDTSRMEAGQLVIHPAPFRLHAIPEDAETTFRPRAEAKGLTFRVDTRQLPPAERMGDLTRIRQIVNNLLENAIKFTTHGHVSFRVALDDGSDPTLRIDVEDSGIGIPKERQWSIFEPFVQVDASMYRQHGGAGLGLAIAAQLTRAMGGTIHVESRPSQGSHFFVRLPCPEGTGTCIASASATCQPRQPMRAADFGPSRGEEVTGTFAVPLRILVAEDHAMNRLFLRRSLTEMGHEVSECSSGRQALSLCLSNSYDLLLLDCQMPEMTGFDVARRIRDHERQESGYLPIIAVTAHATVHDAVRCREAGMDSYLAKPFTIAELLEKIQAVVGRPWPRSA
ncbi:MAG TPA: response regulator, partial [Pirellulaceae bacterium]